uniref:Uncharacterized protein n=1 Tax=Labrus bergylta TaxID=56723 RepID=A0A3Q3ETK6_9LABR
LHQYHEEGGRGHENDLQHPVADEGDWESEIIADVSAPGLLGVAYEVGLLIVPHVLGCNTEDQHAEDEQNGEPDLADHSGMNVHLLQNPPEEVPVPHLHSAIMTCGKSEAERNQTIREYICENVYIES